MARVSEKTAVKILITYLRAGRRAPWYSIEKLRPIVEQYLEETGSGGLNPRYILPELLPDIRAAETLRNHRDPADLIRPPAPAQVDQHAAATEFIDKVLNRRSVLTDRPKAVQLEMIFPPAGDLPIDQPAEAEMPTDGVKLESLDIDIW